MATFRFRLEKILHFMRLKETMKKMEIVSVQKRIGFLQRRKENLENNARELLASQALTYYHTTKIAVDVKESQEMERQIVQERVQLNKSKEELNRLMMRKKGLEALKEKRRREFQVEESRRDQRLLDEAHALRRVGES